MVAVDGLADDGTGPIPKAANWAVGSFLIANIVQYEWCQYRRREEKSRMKRVVQVYDQKQEETRIKRLEEERRRREVEVEVVVAPPRNSGGWSSWIRFW
jgi:cytochrome c oxidase assembly protein subunit 20